ncbi:uncharacterized protein LOC128390305 [Panonychus citri]|uniref:uncharacterized protein LOC128390305 n=1 Tax=Panonychus citri TaxID=50023 RepID=UPI0023077CCB|nr:uncharacterized protein LOC128390305 [Panonychus citri]
MIYSVSIALRFVLIVQTSVLIVFAEHLNDLPWSVDKGNWIIEAKLYKSYNEFYDIREYIYSSDVIRGKIEISHLSGNDKLDIFYSNGFKYDRIVIRDKKCSQYTFSSFRKTWSSELFSSNWTQPILNHLLLTGPSILFRLSNSKLVWTKETDAEIRGFLAHSVSSSIGGINIMSYYKGHTEQSFGPLNTERLQFQGSDNSYQRAQRENFYIDIYKVTKTDEQLDKIVTVTPGYGCSSYLVKKGSNQWINPPNMVRYSLHYISKVYNEGIEKSITQNEVLMTNNLNIVSLKTISQSITTEALYDYTLGIYYTEKEKGKCSILPIGPGSLGLDENNRLSSDLVLNYHDVDKYNYVGKVFLNSESGYEAHVWETTLNHYQIGGKKYDKVVNTQYFVSSPDAELFRDFELVRTTLNGYKKSSTGQYELVDSTRIDYFNLEAKSSDGDFESNLLMRLSDCFPIESKKTFAFHLECDKCKDVDKCLKLGTSKYPFFLSSTRNFFSSSTISVSRLAEIDLIFQDKKMVILITFLDVPDMKG